MFSTFFLPESLLQRYRAVISEGLMSQAPWGKPHWQAAGYCGYDLAPTGGGDFAAWSAWVRAQFGGPGNVGLVSSHNSFKAVFFDMDSTAIAQESLVEIAGAIGRRREVDELTEMAMQGGMDFVTSLKTRLALAKGVSEAVVRSVGKSLTLNPGFGEFVRLCRERHVATFLISGGFTILSGDICQRLGMDGHLANTLEFRDEVFTGELLGEVIDAEAKARYLKAQSQRLQIDLADVVAVGDGANDMLMLKAAGAAIGYRCKPLLHPIIHAYIGNGDHGFLAPLLFGRGAAI